MTRIYRALDPAPDDDPLGAFAESQTVHLDPCAPAAGPGNCPDAPRWKRLLAMAMKPQDIRTGRFRR